MKIDDIFQIYVVRLNRYVTLNNIEIKTEYKSVRSSKQNLEYFFSDMKKIKKRIPKDNYIIALDEKGVNYSSLDLSEKIKSLQDCGTDITFILGGSEGLSKELKSSSNFLLSVSKMTFSHSIAKIILVEQLYRAYTIIKNHPYHRN